MEAVARVPVGRRETFDTPPAADQCLSAPSSRPLPPPRPPLGHLSDRSSALSATLMGGPFSPASRCEEFQHEALARRVTKVSFTVKKDVEGQECSFINAS